MKSARTRSRFPRKGTLILYTVALLNMSLEKDDDFESVSEWESSDCPISITLTVLSEQKACMNLETPISVTCITDYSRITITS